MTRAALTTDQAEAWIAARDACEAKARSMAKAMRDMVRGESGQSAGVTRCQANAVEIVADAIASLEPPRALPDGLAERGA